ncbi:DNA polymerase III subunit gamma/tau [Carnobacteriaceae bacterium zg-ZUI240]|nr:DNA polymerase III subunit gamma/tau [Carnobacteriaceae bacterium zg-ZUI240]
MYQALYRVWRPKSFDDMVGQETIANTLKNSVLTGKISHAYLFSGPRGTGKTSAAKILAKAVNCLQSQDGQPCNACEICTAANDGMLGDIIEIDAASNNGVDEIRDIRDKSRYAPTRARYKVYIIDEVHMLSIGAFNALLKTLEEPTQNVIFILATTEVHKIPATILSRVQRYDFKRINEQDIQNHVKHILQTQNQTYDEKAVALIARMANGGMRDALSLLDQALSYGNGTITLETVANITGAVSQEQLFSYVNAVGAKDGSLAMEQLYNILANGKTPMRLVEELLVFSKDVLLSRMDETDTRFSDVASIGSAFFYRMIDVLSQTQQQLKQNVQQDLYVEVMTMQLIQMDSRINTLSNESASNNELVSNDVVVQLEQRIEQLENKLRALESNAVQTSVVPTYEVKKTPQQKNPTDFVVNTQRIFEVLSQATREDKQKIEDDWFDILSCLSAQRRAQLGRSKVLAASATSVIIGFENGFLCGLTMNDKALRQELSEHAMRIIQHPLEIECLPIGQWQDIRTQFIQAKKAGQFSAPTSQESVELDIQHEEKTQEDEVVTQATSLFGNIVEVMED